MAKKNPKNSTKPAAKKLFTVNNYSSPKKVFTSSLSKSSVSNISILKTPVSRQTIFKSNFKTDSGRNGIQ